MFTFIAPIYLNGKGLSLNYYRISHYRVLAADKAKYTALMKEPLQGCTRLDPIRIEYRFYMKNPAADLMNFGSVVDKYVQDALVKYGIIPNDTPKEVPEVTFIFMGIDKLNPRAEVTLVPLGDFPR